MSDPLNLAGLNSDAIQEAVAKRSTKKESAEASLRADTNAKREQRLQTGPPPPPPQKAPPPQKDKSQLLDKLGAYKERFPDLKSRNKVSAKSTAEEIEDEIHYYQQQLGSRDTHMGSSLLVAAMAGLEAVTTHHWNPLNLNLTGLTQVSKDNEAEFRPIIDELIIKYGCSMYMSPEMRLALAVGTMVYTVHSANSGDIHTAAALQKVNAVAKVAPNDL